MNIKVHGVHSSVAHVLQYFNFEHLKGAPREVSKRYSELAHDLALRITGPEATVALRKLLESKDCAVRAALEGAKR